MKFFAGLLLGLAYNLLLLLLLPLALYKLCWPKPNKPHPGKRWLEYFGLGNTAGEVDLWFHCVSVGEVIAATPLIKKIKDQQPQARILVTTTTATGAEQVVKRLAKQVEHRFAPLDLRPCVWLFLRRYQPRRYWIMETELWPSTLQLSASRGIAPVLVNARLSAKSLASYQRLGALSHWLFSKLGLVLAQHQDDAERFFQLGVSADKLQVCGSVKYDLADTRAVEQQATELRPSLFAQRPVWIAASTHKGEDEQVLKVAEQVRALHPQSLLILVPRHPERFEQVAKLLDDLGLSYVRRSQGQTPSSEDQVYLADSMGEMMLLLAMSDVVLMGGSLQPLGGHNFMEPAALAKPCVAGPHDFNFSDISAQLQNVQALHLSSELEQLANWISEYLTEPEQREKDGKAALAVVEQNRGAIERMLAHY